MRGFELWRDQVNAAGGIKAGGKTYKINFVSYDDESQNTRVQQLYTRLISEDNAQFLFSPYSSGLVATAAIISPMLMTKSVISPSSSYRPLQAKKSGYAA